jgi:hypothetical protein
MLAWRWPWSGEQGAAAEPTALHTHPSCEGTGDWAMGIEADQLISGRGDAGADSPSEIGADDGVPRDKPGVGTGMLGWACRPRMAASLDGGGNSPGRQEARRP